MIPIARPQMGEEEKQRVWDAMASGSLAQGPRVAEFEAAFADMVGVPHAVATSSGTTALHLALLGYDIGPGDEVVTVPFTFIASANSVLYTGARPVFVDVREDDFTLDPDQLEAAITPRAKGVMPTTADAGLAERVRLLREHGMRVRYHHEIVGYNFRMTDLAAAIGLAQLPKLGSFNDRRRAIAARYDAELRGVVTPSVRP